MAVGTVPFVPIAGCFFVVGSLLSARGKTDIKGRSRAGAMGLTGGEGDKSNHCE